MLTIEPAMPVPLIAGESEPAEEEDRRPNPDTEERASRCGAPHAPPVTDALASWQAHAFDHAPPLHVPAASNLGALDNGKVRGGAVV